MSKTTLSGGVLLENEYGSKLDLNWGVLTVHPSPAQQRATSELDEGRVHFGLNMKLAHALIAELQRQYPDRRGGKDRRAIGQGRRGYDPVFTYGDTRRPYDRRSKHDRRKHA